MSKDVDFIVSSVPRTNDVEKLLHDADGIFANASKGTYILDTSTISPIAAKEFYKTAKSHDMCFIDSPMSGGIMGAEKGTLTFMVGSNVDEEFERAKIVLEGMGKNIFSCGGPGTGQIAKIANNLILGINMIAAAEGMVMAEKLGIDPKKLMEILSVSTSGSWVTSAANPRPGNIEGNPASNNYQGGFQTALIRKDMALALECHDAVNSSSEFTKYALDYYTEIEKKGHGSKDFGFVF